MKRFYAQFMRTGDLVFDVGAHVGSRTRLFSELGARVVAIEPQPQCLRALYLNFHDNPQVTIIPQALGAQAGQMAMHLASHSQAATLNPEFVRMMSHAPFLGQVTWNGSRTVNVTTLDALIHKFGVPAFIKIDVEGFEDQVLAGLSQPIPICAFEFHPAYLASALQTIAQFERRGGAHYNYYRMEEMMFRLDRWVSAQEMCDILQAIEDADEFHMGEVYARMNVAPNDANGK